MVIKILLVVAVLLVFVAVMRLPMSSRNTALGRIAVVLLTAAAIVAILWPSLTTHLANFIGVGRGVDLLVYASIIAFVISQISAARKRVILDQKITRLARAVALSQAIKPTDQWHDPYSD